MRTAYDPTAVSPAVVQALPIADKEALLICQQGYIPLQGDLLKVVEQKKAILRKEEKNSN